MYHGIEANNFILGDGKRLVEIYEGRYVSALCAPLEGGGLRGLRKPKTGRMTLGQILVNIGPNSPNINHNFMLSREDHGVIDPINSRTNQVKWSIFEPSRLFYRVTDEL